MSTSLPDPKFTGSPAAAPFAEVRPPEPLMAAQAILEDGSAVVARRYGNPDGPRVVLSHGCGFASDFYWPFWSLLTGDFDVVVYDLRSHGWNDTTNLRLHNIPTLANDNRRILDAIADAFGPKPTVGLYHSLSAIAALWHEHQSPSFAALMLFDPPICPPGANLDEMETVGQRLATGARRRRRKFDAPQQLADRLKEAPAFSLVPDPTLELFAEATLRPAPEGGYQLRCPPQHEAQLFEWFFGHSMQAPEIFEDITIPIRVLGGDPTVPFAFLPSTDLRVLTDLDYDFLPDCTHFMQLEAPETCAAITTDFIQRCAEGL